MDKRMEKKKTLQKLDAFDEKFIAFSAFFLVGGAIFYYILQLFLSLPYAYKTDFRAFYIAGAMLVHGKGDQLYLLSSQFYWQRMYFSQLASHGAVYFPFINPPFTAMLILPF